MEILTCEQGSEEWIDARLGIPTASQFFRIVTPTGRLAGKDVRGGYLDELAAEVISRIQTPHYVSWQMRMNAETEEDSRNIYAMNREVEVRQVGLVYKDERKWFACSPDGLVDPDGGFETKGAIGKIQVARLRENKMISEHIPQVQGSLYICEREWWDFQSYSPGLPELCIRHYRDEKWIKLLSEELEKFCYELATIIRKVKETA